MPSIPISSLTTTGAAGKLGATDTIATAFSGQFDASTVCSDWTSGSTAVQSAIGSVVIVQASGAGDDLLSFTKAPATCDTFNFGITDLGSSGYYSPPKDGAALTFPDSTVSYDGTSHVLQVTLGTPAGQLHLYDQLKRAVLIRQKKFSRTCIRIGRRGSVWCDGGPGPQKHPDGGFRGSGEVMGGTSPLPHPRFRDPPV